MSREEGDQQSAFGNQQQPPRRRGLLHRARRLFPAVVAVAAMTLGGAAPLAPAAAPPDQNAVSIAGPALSVACPGDCSGDLAVTIDEVLLGVNIALGATPVAACQEMDSGGNGSVEIDELLQAVNAALIGCAPVTAGMLKSKGYSSAQTADILEGFGYDCTQCGQALTVEFGADAWEVGEDLKAAGYSCDEVDHALQDLFPGVDSRAVLTDIGCQLGVDPQTAGYDQLGAGYDVFTAYADTEFVKNKILDVDKLNRDDKLLQFDVDKLRVNQYQGTTINQYVTSLSVSAGLSGSYAFFSSSINTTMSQMASVTTEWSFATVQVKSTVHGLSVLKMLPTDLKGYLLPQFSSDINNSSVDPTVLFDLYGTHVIGKLVVGGRLDYNLAALIYDQQQKRNIGVYAEAKLNGTLASLQLNTSFDYSTFQSQYVSNVDVSMSAVGGQGTAVGVWTDSDYTQWVSSVQQHPVFCDFSADPWLIPIWELADGGLADGGCEQASRCSQIQQAYEVYAQGKHINIPAASRDVLTDIAVTVDIPTTQTGFQPLKDSSGSAALAYVNYGVSSARTPQDQADRIYPATKLWIAYKAVGEDQATGPPISGLHFYTGPSDDQIEDSYGPHHELTMKVNGVDQPADLSYDTCEQPTYWETNPCPWICAYYCDHVKCNKPNTKLRQLHFTNVGGANSPSAPIQALVLADRAAIITSNDFATRKNAIWWGPQDLNRDGKVDDSDVQLVLDRVVWVTDTGGTIINLNEAAQNYYTYDYECPWGCCHVKESFSAAPAQYLGYVPYTQ
jgi:hypothetical protein